VGFISTQAIDVITSAQMCARLCLLGVEGGWEHCVQPLWNDQNDLSNSLKHDLFIYLIYLLTAFISFLFRNKAT
jgi:hypothetical protein